MPLIPIGYLSAYVKVLTDSRSDFLGNVAHQQCMQCPPQWHPRIEGGQQPKYPVFTEIENTISFKSRHVKYRDNIYSCIDVVIYGCGFFTVLALLDLGSIISSLKENCKWPTCVVFGKAMSSLWVSYWTIYTQYLEKAGVEYNPEKGMGLCRLLKITVSIVQNARPRQDWTLSRWITVCGTHTRKK